MRTWEDFKKYVKSISESEREYAERLEEQAKHLAELPPEELAKLFAEWDPDFTKLTPEEEEELQEAEESGFISSNEIDWENLGKPQ